MQDNLLKHPILRTISGFVPVRKRRSEYKIYIGDLLMMPNMSFMFHRGAPIEIVTQFASETQPETRNTACDGDLIIAGVEGEMYVVSKSKIHTKYEFSMDGTVAFPEQAIRYAHHYTGPDIGFAASWGERMIATSGDVLVKDGENSVYRIKQSSYQATYEEI